ncbi:MAG: hypothetical protein J3K34DRAFT_425777 [Monoraphidium minutum]|nr:MAG: hypothetical protein J3K34DRAFT_425777 [Monoraphidium minutum]
MRRATVEVQRPAARTGARRGGVRTSAAGWGVQLVKVGACVSVASGGAAAGAGAGALRAASLLRDFEGGVQEEGGKELQGLRMHPANGKLRSMAAIFLLSGPLRWRGCRHTTGCARERGRGARRSKRAGAPPSSVGGKPPPPPQGRRFRASRSAAAPECHTAVVCLVFDVPSGSTIACADHADHAGRASRGGGFWRQTRTESSI